MDSTTIAHPAPAAPNSPKLQVHQAPGRAKRGRLFYLGVAALVLAVAFCLLSVVLLLVAAGMKWG
jgi:hypothetical protein